MKKQLLTIAFMVFAFAGLNAQILTDSLDTYIVGAIGPQADHWTTWTPDTPAQEGIVVDTVAASPSNSMYIGPGQGQDAVLLLGDSATGTYVVSWNMYLPDSAATGYYNFQGAPGIGDVYSFNVWFNDLGAEPGIMSFDDDITATYPVGEWFNVSHKIDLGAGLVEISVNDVPVRLGPYVGNLSSVDFWSVDNANVYYIDDVVISEGVGEPCPVLGSLICDNFESYDETAVIGPQSSIWTTWSGTEGGAEDGIISADYASSGDYSMVIEEGQAQDVVLLMGNYSEGRYSMAWDFLIEAGATGYYNIQGDLPVNTSFPLSTFLNTNTENAGTGFLLGPPLASDSLGQFTYIEDEWNTIEHIIDLDNDLMHILVNGEIVATNVAYPNDLAAIDFFSIDDFNRMYIDDVILQELDGVEVCELGAGELLCDNLDGYLSETTAGQWADHWSTWSGDLGTTEDGLISSDIASSGDNSFLIQEGGTNGGPQDALLLLGDATSGSFELSWMMYVPDSSTAYYNFQGSPDIGTDYVLEIYLGNAAGTAPGTIFFGGAAAEDQGAYPVGEWFEISHHINLDFNSLEISVDGVLQYAGAYVGTTQAEDSGLSSIDFFTTGPTTRYYVDDILLVGNPVGISELSTSDFTIYPNPNNGEFNIVNDSETGLYNINVVDLLGKTVYNESVRLTEGAVANIQLGNINTGVYLVNLSNEDNSTVKVVKMVVR